MSTNKNGMDLLQAELGRLKCVVIANNIDLAHLREKVARLRKALEWVQWVRFQPGQLNCPLCLRDIQDGHKPDCTVGLALRGEK